MESKFITDWGFFQRELKRFVCKRVKDKALAEDIIQDAYLKAQGKIGQLQGTEKISAWIYQIAKNLIVDHYRRQSKYINSLDLHWEAEVPNFNECVARYLNELLPTLPEKYREALQLTEFENLSQVELARYLGISYSGAKSRVQRARQMLKEKIEEVLIVETDSYGNAIVCRDRPCC